MHPYLSDAIVIIAETGYYHRQAHRNVWGEGLVQNSRQERLKKLV